VPACVPRPAATPDGTPAARGPAGPGQQLSVDRFWITRPLRGQYDGQTTFTSPPDKASQVTGFGTQRADLVDQEQRGGVEFGELACQPSMPNRMQLATFRVACVYSAPSSLKLRQASPGQHVLQSQSFGHVRRLPRSATHRPGVCPAIGRGLGRRCLRSRRAGARRVLLLRRTSPALL
jgi:hypothetical protein